jgi:hypothetical protein
MEVVTGTCRRPAVGTEPNVSDVYFRLVRPSAPASSPASLPEDDPWPP